MSDAAPPVHAVDVCVERGGKCILDDISFTAQRGSVLAILGPNGAGKSTLLRAVAGLLPYTGRVAMHGSEVRDIPRPQMARQAAFVPQRSLLASRMRVRAVVGQGRYAHVRGIARPSAADDAAVAQALDITDAQALAEREFTTLSYGEQRRVLLARALATGAEILLLDEPTASLDIAHTLALFALLRSLAQSGRAVIIVLHQLDEARRFADHGLLLHHGKCAASGAIHDVLTAEHVRSVYGVRLVERDALGFRLGD